MLYIILISLLIAFAGIGLHGYLMGVTAPPYDPQSMTLNYERIGHGSKKLVLLHGLTGSLKYWKKGMDNLSESYSVLLIDLLGFGDSPKPNSKYDLDEHVKAIEKVLRKESFDSGGTYLVGHSLGSILAIGLTARHPDWFEELALIGLPFFQDQASIKTNFSKASFWDGVSVDSRYKLVCFFHPIYMTEWFRPKNIPRDIFKDASKHTWASYYRTLDEIIIKTDLTQLVTQIKDKKILLIHGVEDAAAPIENVELLLPIFRNVKYERLEGADHQVYLSNPKKIWSLINDFGKVKLPK